MTEAEKEFERADIANAEKRAKELVDWADQYKSALRELALAKVDLKRIVDSAKTCWKPLFLVNWFQVLIKWRF